MESMQETNNELENLPVSHPQREAKKRPKMHVEGGQLKKQKTGRLSKEVIEEIYEEKPS